MNQVCYKLSGNEILVFSQQILLTMSNYINLIQSDTIHCTIVQLSAFRYTHLNASPVQALQVLIVNIPKEPVQYRSLLGSNWIFDKAQCVLFIARASIICVYMTVQGLKPSFFIW